MALDLMVFAIKMAITEERNFIVEYQPVTENFVIRKRKKNECKIDVKMNVKMNRQQHEDLQIESSYL